MLLSKEKKGIKNTHKTITTHSFQNLLQQIHLILLFAIALISHASKVMLKILQARLQQFVHCELPDVQAGFRKDRGTRDQIAKIRWLIEKARVPEKHLFLLY